MTPRSQNRFLIAATLGAALILSGCTSDDGSASPSGNVVFPDGAVSEAVAALPQESLTPMPTTRLADGLTPPTNRWFSGLVFGDAPEPVFPLPLSFTLTDAGFDFGVPLVDTSANTIAATASIDVSAQLPTMRSSEVVGYDDASVTIALLDSEDASIGTVTIAQGSPLVSFTAETSTTITMATPIEKADSEGLFSIEVGGQTYGMTGDGTVDGSDVTVKHGDTVTWFAVPADQTVEELAASAVPVDQVDLTYSTTDDAATTTLAYGTPDSDETLIAALPHQFAALTAPVKEACDLGTYETVYGTMHLCLARELSWTAPLVEPSDTLSLDAIEESAKTTIVAQLRDDVELPAELPADTYFGGKALYRLANLLQLAEQLGDTKSADTARERLTDALIDWTTADRCATETTFCFVYDPEVKGIVGKVSAFGSDEFNDHHFHYGYLLYAAAVAVADDPALAEKIAPVMDLVAADLATSGTSEYFPDQRVFDAYAGHSWASGYSPFRDGNNQESSSEAVAAWNGLSLWGDATDNSALSVEARWMLANEAATATAYWTNFDDADPVYDGYEHSIVALNWGTKRDYSTWFSAEPNAKLGIQLIPMSPASSYLAADPDRIAENLEEGAAAGYGAQFGDYMLMYSALQGADAAAAAYSEAEKSTSTAMDDANSRAYLLAFIASHAAG